MFGGTFGIQELILLPLGVGYWALGIWAFVDCVRRDFPKHYYNVVWALVIFFVPWAGPIVYLLFGRPQGTLRSPEGS